MKISSDNKLTGNLIAASAGTGKTYQLTSRYLALLALGAKPEKMIALTFTKKAAGEFRNRIFQALAEAALGEADKENARRGAAVVRIWDTWTGLHLTPEWTLTKATNEVALFPAAIPVLKRAVAERCYPENLLPIAGEPELPRLTTKFFAELLLKVLGKSSELQLSTLDSFFHSVVSSDMRRAGLSCITPMNPLQHQRATRSALLAMLAESEKSSHHESALITLLSNIADEKGGSLLDMLETNVNQYLSLYKEFPIREPWGKTEPFQLPNCKDTPLLNDVDITAIEKRIQELVASLSWGNNRRHVKKTFSSIVQNIRSGNFKASPSFTKWLNGEEGFLPEPGQEATDEELKDLIQDFQKHCAQLFLRSVQERSAAMFELLKKYQEAYKTCVLSAGMCTFDDIKQGARRLLCHSAEEEDNGLALNLTTKLDHWMLDEFQDTDPVQWEILSPLLKENSQYPHKTLFVVGDKKQSIYSFRGASSELFEQLRGSIPSTDAFDWQKKVLTISTLKESRRSAPAIIDFTNLVFSGLIEVEKEFSEQMVHESNLSKKGYVRVTTVPDSLAAQSEQDTYTAIGEILEELTEPTTAGHKKLRNGISIAILVRSGKHAKQIVAWLRRYKPTIPVQLVEDSPLCESSPLGELLLSFFLWLQEPADSYRFNLLRISPIGAIMQRGTEKTEQATPGKAWNAWRHLLNRRGYAATIRELAQYLPHTNSRRMLREWLEEAILFDANGGSLDEWILHMRTCSRKETGSPQFVQVMTMHKSKGAEFDAVILPFLGTKAVDQPRQNGIPYFISEDKNGILIHPGTTKERHQWDQLMDCESQWKRAQRDDSYNLLYVALTRARFANYIIVPGGGEPVDNPNKESDWIIHALQQQQYTVTPERPAQFGNKNWYEARTAKAQTERVESDLLALGAVTRPRRHVSPSTLSAKPSAPDKIVSSHNTDGAQFGTDVHTCFEQVTWLTESLPSWYQDPDTTAQKVVTEALGQAEIAALFTPTPHQEVYNEQAIEAINSQNEWISATIDRLVLTYDESGKLTAAHIIDFKTNKPVPHDGYDSFESWLLAHYIGQMRAYRHLISAAFELPESAITVSLLSCPRDYQKHAPQLLTYTAAMLEEQQ